MSHRVLVTDRNLYQRHSFQQPYFVMIGIQEAEKDYILDAIPLSLQVDSSAEEEQVFDQVDTILQCVSRCLPCGFNILGLSVMSNLEQSIITLETTLYVFRRYMEKYEDRYQWKRTLWLNVDERKPLCKLIDLQNGGKSLPCKLKDLNRIPPIYCLEALIELDWTVTSSRNESSVLSWLSKANQSFCAHLSNGVAWVDKSYLCHSKQPDDWLLPLDKKYYRVELLADLWFPSDQELHIVGDCATRLRAQIPCRVYCLGKIPGNKIVSLFVQDWKQSFETIIQIAIEEFGTSVFDVVHSKMMWNLPKRIFIESFQRTVPYCDYVLPEETWQHVADRLSSLLNFTSEECEKTQLCFFEQNNTMPESECLPSASICKLHTLSQQMTPKRHLWNASSLRFWLCAIFVVLFGVFWTILLRKN